MKLKRKVNIIGAGITGCSAAYFLKNDFEVSLYEKSNCIGGLSKTLKNIEGLSYQKGSHVFHTNENWIFDLFNEVLDMEIVDYTVGIDPLFDLRHYQFPFTQESISMMSWHWKEAVKFEIEKASGTNAKNLKQLIINFYGDSAYNQFFEGWIQKWFKTNPKSLNIVDWFRRYLRPITNNTSFFGNRIIAFPTNTGYNKLFDFFTEGVNINFNSEMTYNDLSKNDITICTVRPDKFVNYEKKLDYVCVSFDIDSAIYADNKFDTIIYPNYVPFLSITQFGKFFYNNEDDRNILVKVYPDGEEEAYPVPKKKNYNILNEIKEKYDEIYFIGRLGSYQFLDMADCVKQAADSAATIKHKIKNKEKLK